MFEDELRIVPDFPYSLNCTAMDDVFQVCPHCETLNFRGRKHCSLCKFLLPEETEAANQKNVNWNLVLISMLIVSVGILLMIASLTRPAYLPDTTKASPYLNSEISISK